MAKPNKGGQKLIQIASFRNLIKKPYIVRAFFALICMMVLSAYFSNTVFSKEIGEITLICEPTFVDRKTLRFSGANDGVRPATIIFTINFDSNSVRWWSENFSEENAIIDDQTFLITTSKNLRQGLQVINIRRYTGEWSYGQFSFDAVGKCHETDKPEKRF